MNNKEKDLMTATDKIRRASWTARYKDGSLEIVVSRDLALEIITELEQKIPNLVDPNLTCYGIKS